jgi:hypothetical protein
LASFKDFISHINLTVASFEDLHQPSQHSIGDPVAAVWILEGVACAPEVHFGMYRQMG